MTQLEDQTADRVRTRPPPTTGLLCGLGAYLWWGFIPLYFRAVRHVEPIQVLAHRVIWSLLFLVILTTFTRGWDKLAGALRSRRTMLMLLASTFVLSINWLTYIYAVDDEKVVLAALGYFINPLVSMLLGMVFLRERLRPWQIVGVALATAGVVFMTLSHGQVPWIALSLAISFGLYGLLRKVVPVGAMPGLTVETALLLVPALMLVTAHTVHSTTSYDRPTHLLLGASGIVTAVPLLLFAAATRRLRLSTMGFLQYIGPTCQFLLAVFAFGEPFKVQDFISFALIWSALGVYSTDSYLAYRRAQAREPLLPSAAEP